MANLTQLGFSFFLILLAASLISVSDAGIHLYDDKTLTEALYASESHNTNPATHSKGVSFIRSLDGYVPGDKAPLMMYLYLFIFFAYVVLALVWFARVTWYWTIRIQFQNLVTLVIGLYMYELFFLLSDLAFVYTNETSPVDNTLWLVTISSARKALSRLLLLFLSSGYGIVKPNLGGVTLRMFLATVVCFVLSGAIDLATRFGNVPAKGLTLLALPWTILEICFIQWIFRSLWTTLQKLKRNKRDIAKLKLYKKFACVLVCMIMLNIVWYCVQLFAYCSVNESELWQVEWIISSFWYLLSYALLVFICFSWAPSKKPTRNLYIAEMEDEFEDEEEGVVLTKTEDEDGDAERDERRTVLDAFIIVFGNLPRVNPT